ncbi:hypothetical protein C0992_003030 [Termitomyces sp. T32_za158]|nr:hypothetical protein C0992_003030 [Termitomyces sp. T32_za158]
MPRRSARLAGSTAHRTNPAVKLQSLETDAAVGHHESSPGPDSERSDESVRPQKRRKQSGRKQSKPNASSLHPSLQFKNVRGRRGALKDIVEMPFDILHEIFMYLTPVEVLSLSRMCKALRRILMTKTAEYVWKQARLNLEDFPDCPDDLNEPQFANFIFSSLCNNYTDTFSAESLHVDVYAPDLICEASANRLIKEFNGISDRKAQEAWMEEQKEERQRRITHGRLCEEWLTKQDHQRAEQLVEIRNRRYEAIKQRLIDLGWGKELETIKGLQQWPSVRQPKDLTDRIWRNIKDDIIDKMKEYRASRMKEAYLNAQRNRRSLLNKGLRDLQQKHRGKLIFPDISDIESTGQVSTLIKAPTEETIEFPDSLVLELAQNWRNSSDIVLRDMIVTGPTPSSKLDGVDPLLLATTYFSCWKRDYDCRVVFQYPEVLETRHPCVVSVPDKELCRPHFRGKGVLFSDKAYSLAREILEAAGFDPDTTMRKDVQWPAFIVECHECSLSRMDEGVRAFMTWNAAIEHDILHDYRRQPSRMVRADLSDTELERVHELAVKDITMSHNNLFSPPTKTGTIKFEYAGDENGEFIGEYSTYVKQFGDPKDTTRTPLIVLHGGPGLVHDYLVPFSDLFTKYGTPVILYDQLGNGLSSHLRDVPSKFWKIDMFIDELVNVINALEIQDSFALAGHSWGGILAAEFAVRRQPEGLKHLILTDSLASIALWNQSNAQLMQAFPMTVQEGLKSGMKDPSKFFAALKEFHAVHGCTVNPFPPEYLFTLEQVFGPHGDPTVAAAPVLDNWSIVEELPRIKAPTLVINGRNDISQDFVVKPFFDGIERVKWVTFEKSTHSPFFEERTRYMELINDFLN